MPTAEDLRLHRWALLVLLLGLVSAGCGRAGGDPFQPTQNTPVQIPVGGTLAQTVNPAGDQVSAVDLQVATYAEVPDPSAALEVTLRDPADGTELARTTVPAEELEDLAWVSARFSPAVSVPDVVLVEASWEGRTPLALLANVPEGPQTRRSLPNDPYEDGQLVVDGRPAVGDLAFRVRGGGGPAAALDQIGEVVASTGSRLLDQPVFAAAWTALLVGAVALAVWGLRRRPAGDAVPGRPQA